MLGDRRHQAGGAAIARKLAEQGAHVVLNYFHDNKAAARTLAAFQDAGLSAEIIRASVARPDDVDRMFKQIEDTHGRLDILVNSAVYGVFKPFTEITEREWKRTVETCFDGARLCSRGALPLMHRSGGTIVNISSLGAGMVVGYYASVGPVKAAIEALTRYLAVEYAPHDIRVNAVSCGMFDGAWTERFPDSADTLRVARQATPLGRLSSPEDQAEAVAYLVSDAARWITGQTLTMDGGASTGFYSLSPPSYPLDNRSASQTAREAERTAEPSPGTSETTHQVASLSANDRPASDRHEEVAIVGMGVLAPGVGSAEGLWDCSGRANRSTATTRQDLTWRTSQGPTVKTRPEHGLRDCCTAARCPSRRAPTEKSPGWNLPTGTSAHGSGTRSDKPSPPAWSMRTTVPT
ncbi:SDR family oxidoreductase [Streptomyces sp. cg35]|uniref:SDR family oxidoreductase n=1 Tax=Streptomyces sp. cg35 TaxID=3421650 RepID=UPI003D162E43